jgi:hypothetical protein
MRLVEGPAYRAIRRAARPRPAIPARGFGRATATKVNGAGSEKVNAGAESGVFTLKVPCDAAALAIKPGVAQQEAAPAERADPEVAESGRKSPQMVEIALAARGARNP